MNDFSDTIPVQYRPRIPRHRKPVCSWFTINLAVALVLTLGAYVLVSIARG